MTNREKYAEEILDIVCRGMNVGIENNKVKACTEINYCKDCDLCEKNNIGTECREHFTKWAEQEYIPYVDWSKVAVDTPILVKNNEEEKWVKRYFARYEDNKVFAWRVGATSWSSDNYDDVLSWNYTKLPEETEE